jgi:hypothetical protein
MVLRDDLFGHDVSHAAVVLLVDHVDFVGILRE